MLIRLVPNASFSPAVWGGVHTFGKQPDKHGFKIADGGSSSAMLREYSFASMLRNPKLVGLLDSRLGNTPDCHLPYVQVKPIYALSDSAAQ
jgi:hypothetical protein